MYCTIVPIATYKIEQRKIVFVRFKGAIEEKRVGRGFELLQAVGVYKDEVVEMAIGIDSVCRRFVDAKNAKAQKLTHSGGTNLIG